MKKASFLLKLHEEGKVRECEPSLNLKKAYLSRAAESLSSAKALLKMGNLRDSVALSYYSMYHALLALLFRTGIKCENHSAAIVLMKDAFGLDNSAISKAKEERVDKQYYVDFEVQKEEAAEAIAVAEEFIAKITDFAEKLSEEKMKDYHGRAMAVILGK